MGRATASFEFVCTTEFLQTHSPTRAIVTLRTILGRVEFFASEWNIHMVNYICNYYTKGSPAEIETPTQWDLIGSSTTVPPPMPSPSSILPPTSSSGAVFWRLYYLFPQAKLRCVFKHVIISLFLL